METPLTIWMFVGFLLAAYSVVGNDSIQTLGTFIASNRKYKWYHLWFFMGSILIFTIIYSWYINDGDISYGRLTRVAVVEIRWYHAIAPLVLFFMTRKGIPASTSLLVLSAFSSAVLLEKVILKSAIGYGLSATTAYLLWLWLSRWDEKTKPIKAKYRKHWRIFQWIATGFLWHSWLTHGLTNIAIFLPRNMNLGILLMVIIIMSVGLAYIFKSNGGKIQNIILSKKDTVYVRSATLIDLFYALVLIFFKEYNNIPMSTTWVFVGVLCGRELAISTRLRDRYKFKEVFPVVGKDLLKLFFGLAVSVTVAFLFQYLGNALA